MIDDLSRRMSEVNGDVQLMVNRFFHSIELLEEWVSEHPDEQLARHTRNLISHWKAS